MKIRDLKRRSGSSQVSCWHAQGGGSYARGDVFPSEEDGVLTGVTREKEVATGKEHLMLTRKVGDSESSLTLFKMNGALAWLSMLTTPSFVPPP